VSRLSILPRFFPQRRIGQQWRWPLASRLDNPVTGKREIISPLRGQNYRGMYEFYHDFDVDPTADKADHPWTKLDVKTGGTNAFAVAAAGAFGEMEFKTSATSELNIVGLSFGDSNRLPGNLPYWFEVRAKKASLAANHILVIGLADDHDNDPSAVARRVWFKYNASNALLIEGDDDDTAHNNVAAGVTVDTGYHRYLIDGSNPHHPHFYFDGVRVGSLRLPELDATTLQPYIALRKAEGTTQPTVTLDQIYGYSLRE
jgi:hypothetical protein